MTKKRAHGEGSMGRGGGGRASPMPDGKNNKRRGRGPVIRTLAVLSRGEDYFVMRMPTSSVEKPFSIGSISGRITSSMAAVSGSALCR